MQWRESAKLPDNVGKTRISLVSLDNIIYMFGGASSKYYNDDVYEYEWYNGLWLHIGKMKVKRESFALSVVNYYHVCKK